MSNDGTIRPISSNINCCSLLKNSETCRQIKEGTLLLIQGVALVAIGGSVLAILAINGVNLGGINTLTTLVAQKWVYITFVTGLSLLAINTALIVALTRNHYNKQYTQREFDHYGLGEWVQQYDILSKLEPGQYWRFPVELEQPVRGDNGRTAIFGAVVRDFNKTPGVYAFRTKEDFLALMHQLGYQDGERAFTHSATYTEGYIDTKLSHEQKADLANQKSVKLSNGEYSKISFTIEIDEEATNVYGLRFKKEGVERLYYFKTRELRELAQQGLLDHRAIGQAIEELPPLPYLPARSLWEVEDPIRVTPFGQDQEEREFYVLFVKNTVAGDSTPFYFSTREECSVFAHAYAHRHSLQDAKAAWNHPTFFPNDWVEAKFDVRAFNETPLEALQYTYCCIGKRKIFALRICHSATEVENLYFKTEQARKAYVESALSMGGYVDVRGNKAKADELIKED